MAKSMCDVFAIDYQGGFNDDPMGGLPVAGASADAERFATWFRTNGAHVRRCILTLDSHPVNHISESPWWVCGQDGYTDPATGDTSYNKGDHPVPGTQITHQSVVDGIWLARGGDTEIPHLKRTHQQHVEFYTRELEAHGRYTHTIWSRHCPVGRSGHGLIESVGDAVTWWEETFFRNAQFYTKGMDPFFERFGALGSEVIDPLAPSTQIDEKFVNQLANLGDVGGMIIVGEASSHCVRATVDQTIAYFEANSPEIIRKLVLFTDCMSPVVIPGVIDYTDEANAWFEEVKAKGVTVTTSDQFQLAA